MGTASTRFFAYRHNQNGFCDSICLDCFQVVSSNKSRAELAIKEQAHICDPDELDRQSAQSLHVNEATLLLPKRTLRSPSH